ncbi:MAG TPA: acyloxyacyl hydrolase [Terracidiphilus sp.]|nr:acyloxyacyl hydrolase [Terracidiphilus sp.]
MCNRFVFFASFTVLALPLNGAAQTETAPYRFSGGYATLSNSFNGLPGAHQPLTGWDASAALPAWHNLRFKIDVSAFSGTNLNAQQHALFILGGAQYEYAIRREHVFAQALVGDGGFNRFWGPNAAPGDTASFSELLGGGLDTPITRHFALRVEANLQHTNLALIQSLTYALPSHFAGQPNYLGRYGAGLVWTPRYEPVRKNSSDSSQPIQNELVFESLNSFGHYHIFAYTWWSYLNVAGVEYDRHSWGSGLGGARLDYVAEVLPVVLLRQPAETDVWGDPFSTTHKTVPGLGISPIGIRILWGDGKRCKPYYTIKGGMIGFTHKALANYGSYENFSLQQAVGLQFHLGDRFDFRTGLSDFHFSNGFIVPNNPGIDEMSYNIGLSYKFESKPFRF